MPEPVTHSQLQTVKEEIKSFIDDKFVEHEKVEMLIKESLDKRIDAREKEIKSINKTLEGNGNPGIIKLVDRMWQDHGSTIWWLRIVGASVVGKILFDVFTK
jgi:hypothetical protein